MKKIKISDRDLDNLEQLSYLDRGDRKFYLIDGELAKVYINLKNNECKQYRLQRKIEMLQDLKNIKGLVIPTKQVFYNGDFAGFTEPYYEQSVSLNSYDVSNNEEYIELLRNISNLLKQLHQRNVVWGDLSFSNILITNEGIKFIDLDGCGIGLFEPDYYSRQAYNFSTYNSLSNKIITTKEFDKLSLFVEFICYQFMATNFNSDYVTGIRPKEYEYFCENVNSELKYYLNIVKNYFKPSSFIKRKDLPYIGDVIKNDDLYTGRAKKLNLKKEAFLDCYYNGMFYD